ncbi:MULTISPECIES: MlaD family protein [unclassified Saccharibacter]|uniref:Toluene ABC transporter periplasmic protein n=2 Tax=Acetobacteraceae TaxID=433 RepID=A0ABQ0NW14_9PROT|nr:MULTISPECIES: MlaD family protein [unclassified Saccharibacter]GBQ04736.1 toluene ABC transporter periplasmic protein [Saccharibacter floricola DSM 15669]
MIKGRGGAFLASAAVLCLAGGFLLYGARLSQGPVGDLATYHASFPSANGLAKGAGVELGGVSVGHVEAITLNSELAIADVRFDVEKSIRLPSDTAVTIGAPTMSGDNVLKILPGKSASFLAEGSTIIDARPLLSLEQQISNYIFNAGKL